MEVRVYAWVLLCQHNHKECMCVCVCVCVCVGVCLRVGCVELLGEVVVAPLKEKSGPSK